ncbi:MAG: diacylglycerol/lipid kinase family protein [Pirellulaceae bacterium]
MGQRLAIIVNPKGGAGRGMAILEQVRPVFVAAGMELKVHTTTHRGHASELAERLDLAGYAGLCCIGGDGTNHEVVCGLMQRAHPAEVPLGIIPGGTGNSMAENLNCLDPVTAARKIIQGNIVPLDVARVSSEAGVDYSINIVGWGAAVDINRTAERLRWLGAVRYSAAALWEILRARRRPLQLTLDGEVTEDRFHMVVACNTRFTGSGMQLAPRAKLDDRLLDVIIVRRATRRQMLQLFRRVFDGSHVDLPFVEYRQVATLELSSPGCEPLNLDGELKRNLPIRVEIVPAALRLFA